MASSKHAMSCSGISSLVLDMGDMIGLGGCFVGALQVAFEEGTGKEGMERDGSSPIMTVLMDFVLGLIMFLDFEGKENIGA